MSAFGTRSRLCRCLAFWRALTTGPGRIWAAAAVAVAAAAWTAPAQQARDGLPAASTASVRPTTRVTSCVQGGCHAKEVGYRYLHGPVAVGACGMCHVYDDVSKHTFKRKHAKKDQCNFCHIERIQGEVVHKPVAQGQCLGCHNPHGSSNREMLRKKDMGALCASCHDDVTRGKQHVHGPVATGACGACHRSHSSRYPKLLVAEGRQLCLDCHKEMGRQLLGVRYLHKPVEKGPCLACHEPHASGHPKQLKLAARDLCVSCHEHKQILTAASAAAYKHSPMTEGKTCMNCHTAHGGDLAKLMRGRPVHICLTCHDKPIESIDGKEKVPAVAEVIDPGLYKHGPVRDGTCSGCHTVHGGELSRLLVKPYPATFYRPFEVGEYGLCFGCHNPQLALARETTSVTGFRNGSRNLHYVHVNRAKKGRTCRACHNTHASKNAMHIPESVPFGNWKLPVTFKASATGGSCQAGCHKELAYDRVNPVRRKPAAESQAPKAAAQGRPTSAPAPRSPGPNGRGAGTSDKGTSP